MSSSPPTGPATPQQMASVRESCADTASPAGPGGASLLLAGCAVGQCTPPFVEFLSGQGAGLGCQGWDRCGAGGLLETPMGKGHVLFSHWWVWPGNGDSHPKNN